MRSPAHYTLRAVTASDADVVCVHRAAIVSEVGGARPSAQTADAAAFRDWLMPLLVSGDYAGWLAMSRDNVIAGVGLVLVDWPPHPAGGRDRRSGYVMNVYVEPVHRRRGVARLLVARTVTEAHRRGLRTLVLHASGAARALYEKLGWKSTPEMVLTIADATRGYDKFK